MQQLFILFLATITLMTFSNSNAMTISAESNVVKKTADISQFKEFIFVSNHKYEDAEKLVQDMEQAAIDSQTNKISLGNLIDFSKEREDLALQGTINLKFSGANQVSSLIEQIADQTLFHLGLPFTNANRELYQEKISNAFINLKEQEHMDWFDIHSDGDSNSPTTYTYNMVFLIERDAVFLALPLILTVEIDTTEEKVLNLTKNDFINYELRQRGLRIMQLVN
ncbi:hypothetical protein IC619_012775 [Hazenella sp. IB182353]|uniref:hypothetical protein n=1 Tax=Polycladospora coralii TaxID=2771432 RepID=UPI001745C89F|nr:hypothetical protein [Polycladospora coralii]MBS7531368.1 hypothetical protein [Polycladospora coralii]